MMTYILIIASPALCVPFSSQAALKIPDVFASNMILQRRQLIPVWCQSEAHSYIICLTPDTVPDSGTGKSYDYSLQGFEAANVVYPGRFTTATAHISDQRMNKQIISLTLVLPLATLGICILGQACKKGTGSPGKSDTAVAKTITQLPAREVKVYIGISDRWHEMADQANYGHCKYEGSGSVEQAPPADGYFHQRTAAAPWRRPHYNPAGI